MINLDNMDKSFKPSTSYAVVVSGLESNYNYDETSRSWLTGVPSGK